MLQDWSAYKYQWWKRCKGPWWRGPPSQLQCVKGTFSMSAKFQLVFFLTVFKLNFKLFLDAFTTFFPQLLMQLTRAPCGANKTGEPVDYSLPPSMYQRRLGFSYTRPYRRWQPKILKSKQSLGMCWIILVHKYNLQSGPRHVLST